MLAAHEMPADNALLALIEIEFPFLEPDSADSCPVPIGEVLGYLALEVPDGRLLAASDLKFERTALVEATRYWIWRFVEPDGDPAFVTCAVGPLVTALGYEVDYYGLCPAQFILGDYHNVF